MQESVTYQAILREGREEGREEKQREIALNFLQDGFPVEAIARNTGLSISQVEQLQQQLNQSN
jgi:predicted transposase/invertase (TIGR01784 family)